MGRVGNLFLHHPFWQVGRASLAVDQPRWKMNHSIEFGRSSWAGANWKTSPGRLSAATWMTSAPPSSSYSAASQGPSVWVTTNQRTYKSEPVMARAREMEFQKRLAAIGRDQPS